MHRPRWLAGGLGLLGTWMCGFSIASCIETDPDHCRYNNGDVFCSGATPYCDECKSSAENGGCVAEPPEGACYFGGDEPFAGDSTGSGSDSGSGSEGDDGEVDGSSDGPPVACTMEGDRDDACPEDEPFCVGAICVDCNEGGGDALCFGTDSTLPACGPAGQCQQCTTTSDIACSGAKDRCSPEGVCVECSEHAHCDDGHGCDLAMGTCLDGPVYYVGGSDCPGFGSEATPWCDPASAQAAIDGLMGDREVTVRLVGTEPINGNLTIDGEGSVLVVVAHTGQSVELGSGQAVRADDGARIFVEGVTLTGNGMANVRCASGSSMWLRDTRVIGNPGAFGILASGGCDLTVERSVITGNANGGIEAVGTTMRLLSSVVAANGDAGMDTPGLDLDGGTVSLRHSTLIANRSSGGGRNITCRSAVNLSIVNSIVVHNPGQSIVGCGDPNIRNSAIDDAGLENVDAGAVVVAYTPNDFVDPDAGDVHLDGTTPYVEIARWELGDPFVDLDGDALQVLVGATNAAGADQP